MIVFCLIACLFLTVSGVSATTVDDNGTQVEISMDTDLVSVGTLGVSDELVSGAENKSVLGSSDEGSNVLGAGDGSYDDLKEELSSNSNYITLKNKIYDGSGNLYSTISLANNNTIIDGNGAIITNFKSSTIFLKITGENVTIKNIHFQNIQSTSVASAYEYGAIVWYGKNGIFINCTATECYSGSNGGVLNSYGSNFTMEDCVFKDNKAKYHCGAVWLYGWNATARNCTFTNNYAETFEATLNIIGC